MIFNTTENNHIDFLTIEEDFIEGVLHTDSLETSYNFNRCFRKSLYGKTKSHKITHYKFLMQSEDGNFSYQDSMEGVKETVTTLEDNLNSCFFYLNREKNEEQQECFLAVGKFKSLLDVKIKLKNLIFYPIPMGNKTSKKLNSILECPLKLGDNNNSMIQAINPDQHLFTYQGKEKEMICYFIIHFGSYGEIFSNDINSQLINYFKTPKTITTSNQKIDLDEEIDNSYDQFKEVSSYYFHFSPYETLFFNSVDIEKLKATKEDYIIKKLNITKTHPYHFYFTISSKYPYDILGDIKKCLKQSNLLKNEAL